MEPVTDFFSAPDTWQDKPTRCRRQVERWSPRSVHDVPTRREGRNGQHDPDDLSQEWRRLLAEFFDTFALTPVAAGGAVFAATGAGGNGKAAQVIAPALLVMAMIYTVGDVSGAHFNPAVTLAFTLRRDFPLDPRTRLLGHADRSGQRCCGPCSAPPGTWVPLCPMPVTPGP